jgi:hypothetical protein
VVVWVQHYCFTYLSIQLCTDKQLNRSVCSFVLQPEDLNFRQTPTFADCFPGSEKCYNTVEYKGHTMQVRVLAVSSSKEKWQEL